MRPDVGTSGTRVLLAVLTMPHPTVRSVAAHAGLSPATTMGHLQRLRRLGLVGWQPGHRGTLHATCTAHQPSTEI